MLKLFWQKNLFRELPSPSSNSVFFLSFIVSPFRPSKTLDATLPRRRSPPPAAMDLLRSQLHKVRIPEPGSRIHKDECCVSFDTPVTAPCPPVFLLVFASIC